MIGNNKTASYVNVTEIETTQATLFTENISISTQFSRLQVTKTTDENILILLYVSLGFFFIVVLIAIVFTVYRFKRKITSESMYEFKSDSFNESGSFRTV